MDRTRADALRAAVEALAAEDVADVVEQARAEARVRVKDLLADALTDALVDNVHAELARPVRELPEDPEPRRTPRPEPPARPAPHVPPAPLRSAPPRSAPPPAAPTGYGVYVYGVVPAGTSLPSDLPGVDLDSSPRLLTHGDVAAVISDVPLSEFEEQRLRENLGDLRWVERTARAHEHVLETIADHSTLVPMRMCSIYRTPAGVQEMLAREARPLADALRQLEGKTEWGVKVFADEARQRSARREGDGEPPASGTDYMRRRQDDRDARWRIDDELAEACDAIHERLSVVSADALTVPPQRPEMTGRDGQMLLNGVYLVEAIHEQLFLATVEELRASYAPLGLELVPTGPWPAYNFVPGAIGAAW